MPLDFLSPLRRTVRGRLLAAAALAACGAGVSGCASVASSYAPPGAGQAAKAAEGVPYSLPVKTMTVVIGTDQYGLFVAVTALRIEGEAGASYRLSYNPESSSADTFDVSVDPDTGLLSSVKTDADSKVADALAALAKSAGQIAGAFELNATGTTRLYAARPFTYWPRGTMTPKEAQAELDASNQEINRLVEEVVRVHGCLLKDPLVLSPAQRGRICDAQGKVKRAALEQVTIKIAYQPYAAGPVDCTVGICTRVQRMAQMTLDTPGSHDAARIPLPNGSAPLALPLRRVPFTKATTEYTLVDGLVSKTSFAKGAELPAIFALPGQLIGSFVGGVVDGVAQAGNLRKARTDAAASKKAASDSAGSVGTSGHNELAMDRAPGKFDADLLMLVYPLPKPAVAGAVVPPAKPAARGVDGNRSLPQPAPAAPPRQGDLSADTPTTATGDCPTGDNCASN